MKTDMILAVTALVAIIVLGAVAVFAIMPKGNGSVASNHLITVTATGTVYALPDRAVIGINVNGTGATAQAASQNLSASVTQLNNTLMGYVNSNTSLITTTSYSFYRIFNSTRYGAFESVEVTLPDINQTNNLLGSISNLTNVYVTSVTPTLSNAKVTELRSAALSAALMNATTQAEVLAGPNATVTSTNMSISSYNVYPIYGSGLVASANGGVTSPSATFYSGRVSVVENVYVVFSYSKNG